MCSKQIFYFKECPPAADILNGNTVTVNQLRDGLLLENDVIRYKCDEEYRFYAGSKDDYVYKCQGGGWNSTVIPICITGKFALPSTFFTMF